MTHATALILVIATLAQTPHTAEAPLPPAEAAATMRVPDGFRVTLFAGEPDVVQPIAMCIDDRGRLWIAEANNYPHKNAGLLDRILIFEDTDGDGRHDKRTVFYDKLEYVTGVEVGFGGVWVMSPPHFYFIPDRDGDGVPDGEPIVVLDGFGTHANAHNLANHFAWGPDGWLYATHGRTNWSLVGPPGTPDEERLRLDGGVWRYHPVTKRYEWFADGTTNPWGVDWDDYGAAFVCNCVNPHLFHVIQGAHYEPWRDRESSRYAYRRIDTIADHLHWAGNDIRPKLADAIDATSEAGGGHAHCGTMVYLGDSFPPEYRNSVFLHNIHGRRINRDVLRFRGRGSGYVASHAPDFMLSADPWYMGVSLQYGPDGSVYSIDWSDTGECHSVKNTRKETGRVYRIAYEGEEKGQGQRARGQGGGKDAEPTSLGPRPSALGPSELNIAALTDAELVRLQFHRNDWYVRHARRVLHEREAAGRLSGDVAPTLLRHLRDQDGVPLKLRMLWALHVIGAVDQPLIHELLESPHEHMRGWAVQLELEDREVSPDTHAKLVAMAAEDPSPVFRLFLASALQRMPHDQRWPIAERLAQHEEDIDDPNLPLMIWYGIEPAVAADRQRAVAFVTKAKIPLLRQFAARRLAEK